MASSYKPGHQNNRWRTGKFKFSHNRVAWVNTAISKLAILRYTEEEMREYEKLAPGEVYEPGDTIRLLVVNGTGRQFTLDVTAMTFEEFVAFRDILTLLLRMAEPIIKARDRKAAEHHAAGDDSYVRSYRQLPQFIIRERTLGEHSPELLRGLEYALVRPPGINDPDGAVRGPGAAVAEPVPEDQESQDNGEETDEPESLR